MVRAEAARTTKLNETQTRDSAEPLDTEEQTRKFNQSEFARNANEFENRAHFVPNRRTATVDIHENKRNIKIGILSLPENLLTTLPYIPFSIIGIVASLLELFLVNKSEPKVRFHAAQGLAAHIGIWMVLALLGGMNRVTGSLGWAVDVFSLVTMIMLIVFAVKAWQGKPIHILYVESLTDWLEEKIAPKD